MKSAYVYEHVRAVPFLFVALIALGCHHDDIDTILDTPPDEVGAVAFLMKNEKPFIMVNLTPEKKRFESWDLEDRKRYLRQRAVEIVRDYALVRENYAMHDSFVMRMMFLNGKDDYDRPAWGDASDVVLFELKRSNVADLRGKKLAQVSRAVIQDVFIGQEFKR